MEEYEKCSDATRFSDTINYFHIMTQLNHSSLYVYIRDQSDTLRPAVLQTPTRWRDPNLGLTIECYL